MMPLGGMCLGLRKIKLLRNIASPNENKKEFKTF